MEWMMIGDGGNDADVSGQVEAQEGKVILPGNAAKLTSWTALTGSWPHLGNSFLRCFTLTPASSVGSTSNMSSSSLLGETSSDVTVPLRQSPITGKYQGLATPNLPGATVSMYRMMREKRRQSKRNINHTAPIVRGSSGSPLVNRLAHCSPDPLDSADINILIPQIRFTLGTRPIAILLVKE